VAIYVYKCPSCTYTEEVDFPMGTAPEVIDVCLACDSSIMYRKYLPSAVSFKGSGFYTTDNPKTKHVRSSLKVGGNGS